MFKFQLPPYTGIIVLMFFLIIPVSAIAQEFGLAASYPNYLSGATTANGEKYQPEHFTAAHKDFPFESHVRVTNLKNGHSVLVRINDRIPKFSGHIIEVSRAAAEEIGLEPDTEIDVRIDQVVNDQPGEFNAKSASTTDVNQVKEDKVVVVNAEANEKISEEKPTGIFPKDLEGSVLMSINLTAEKSPSGYGLQIGSFKSLENVLQGVSQLQEYDPNKVLLFQDSENNSEKIYKVIFGPFWQKDLLMEWKQILQKDGIQSFSVELGKL